MKISLPVKGVLNRHLGYIKLGKTGIAIKEGNDDDGLNQYTGSAR